MNISDNFLFFSLFLILFILFSFDLVMNNYIFSIKKSLIYFIFWILIFFIVVFYIWLYLFKNNKIFAEYTAISLITGFLIEKVLIIDNLFIWITIFKYFNLPINRQRYLINLGILGIVFSRIFVIIFGSWLIYKFQWLVQIFGIFLIIVAFRTIILNKKKIKNNFLINFLKKNFRIVEAKGKKLFLKKNNKVYITYSLLALIYIEVSDILFSIDSIPVMFSINIDPFVILVSNLFSILGINSMFMLIVKLYENFFFIKYMISIILIFIGMKMILFNIVNIPILLSLLTILFIILISVILNIIFNKS